MMLAYYLFEYTTYLLKKHYIIFAYHV